MNIRRKHATVALAVSDHQRPLAIRFCRYERLSTQTRILGSAKRQSGSRSMGKETRANKPVNERHEPTFFVAEAL
ncbi:hypothetical protein MACH17_39530 [Phaeobacter inhibens]|nr:hypothetical protein MACH17_39530 [Phaeobacter inhibens]